MRLPGISGRRARSAVSTRRRRVWLASTAVLGLLVAIILVDLTSESTDGRNGTDGQEGMTFGVLGGSCDPERLRQESAAGITVVELDTGWDAFEPRDGAVDQSYLRDLRDKITACRDAGMQVVLSLGLQFPPAWARDLPSGRLLDQNGRPPTLGNGLDLVFSGAVRQAVADYFARFSAGIGFDGIRAVRLGTDAVGELAYPGPGEGSSPDGHAYWAFNEAAQTGVGIADGMAPSPMPGWLPGDPTWRGQRVGSDQVASWFTWYSRALVSSISWQAQQLRAVGFSGEFHVPVAGSGALPADLAAAVRGNLDGRNDPIGALERGLYYPDQFFLLAALDDRLRAAAPGRGIVVDFTGLDDVSAVAARRLTPPQDTCQAGDPDVAASGTGVEGWSAQRFTIATARHHGLEVIGENPGPSDLPNTGGSADSDTLAEQLVRATEYARECQLSMFLFAFEEQLFDRSSGVDLDEYAREISPR